MYDVTMMSFLCRVATNLENMENLENSGKLKIVKISVKTQGNLNFKRKNLESSGKCRICGRIGDKMYSSELFFPELLKENFENDLEISGNTQGIWSFKNVATLLCFHQ